MFIWIPLHTPRFFFRMLCSRSLPSKLETRSSRVKPSKAMFRRWKVGSQVLKQFFFEVAGCLLNNKKSIKLTTFWKNLGCCFEESHLLVLNFIDGNRFKKQGTLLQGTFGLARPEPEAVQIKTKWQENDLRNASSLWFPCRFYIQISKCIAMQNAVWCRKNTI